MSSEILHPPEIEPLRIADVRQFSIRRALAEKSFLITGATGFLGKTFLERLLRTSESTAPIYLLIRARDLRSAQDRFLKEILGSVIFDSFRNRGTERYHRAIARVHVLLGDGSLPELGLSATDLADVLRDVDLFVNCAASVEFQDTLNHALLNNVQSVAHLAQVALRSQKAKILHISTCYVSGKKEGLVQEEEACERDEASIRVTIEEERRRDDPAVALAIARRFEFNDVYTMTKWMAERHLMTLQRTHPHRIVILRPSIIESAHAEPRAGWIEGFKVADPLIMLTGSGRVQHFCGDGDHPLDIIPVDFVVNAMFIAGASVCARGSSLRPEILQVASSHRFPLHLKDLYRYVASFFSDRMRADRRSYYLNPLRFRGYLTLLAFASLLVWCVRPRRGGMMRKGVRMLRKMVKLYGPYTSLNIAYCTENLRLLHSLLPKREREEYPIEFGKERWSTYLKEIHIPGLIKNVAAAEALKPTAAGTDESEDHKEAA